MDTVLILIRHGETEWNRDGRWQGHADVPLSELGREQARRLAARARAEGWRFDHIYTSDLSRALETAQIVGAALGMAPAPLLELREINLGTWSGLNRDEIAARYAEDWALMQAGQDIRRGGGESFADLQQRVVRVLEQLIREHPGQRLGIFTHGGVIRALLAHIQRIGWEQIKLLHRIENTSITTLSAGPAGWRIKQINDIAHLEGLEPAVDVMAPSGEAHNT
ncbi:MAG: phosphoglycerate mutase [Herpetosiphonaceae bacterium]|nr:MAG: phosphoglycerate mutase [Herpetosiphonaceae bacterium]